MSSFMTFAAAAVNQFWSVEKACGEGDAVGVAEFVGEGEAVAGAFIFTVIAAEANMPVLLLVAL